MSEEIKPCPFCGGAAKLVMDTPWWRVYCSVCGASSGGWLSEHNSVSEWNRRAPSEAVGLLRDVLAVWDAPRGYEEHGKMDVEFDKIRRFLAAQDKEST